MVENAALWSKFITTNFLSWLGTCSMKDFLLKTIFILDVCTLFLLATSVQLWSATKLLAISFVNCHFAKVFWDWLSLLFNTRFPPLGNVCDLLRVYFKHTLMSSLEILYDIWKAMNKLKSLKIFNLQLHV